MARKSQWAQFAENFKSTYELVNDVKQGYDTKQIMDDEKFLAKDGKGFGLKDSALERARYKALGDIATKYGDSEGGLANRTALANLDSVDRQNRMDESTFAYRERIDGLLAEAALRANTANTQSSTGLNNANSSKIRQLTPFEIKKLQADTGGTEAETALTQAQTTEVAPNAESNRGLQATQGDLNTATAARTTKLSPAELLQIQAKTSNTDAGTDLTAAQTTEVGPDAEAARALKEAQAASNNASAGLTTAQTVKLDAENTGAEVLLQNQATINTLLANINDTSEGGYADQNNIKTDADATAHAVKMLEQADMPLELKQSAISGLNAFTLGGLQEQSAILVAQAEASMQVEDPLQGIVDFYDGVNDGQNGDTNSLSVVQTDTGFKIVQTSGTGENAVSKDLMTADGEDAKEVLQTKLLAQIKNPGNMLAISADVLANQKAQSGISKTDSETNVNDAQVGVLNAQTKKLLSDANVDTVQIKKMEAEILKINKDVENSDQTDSARVREEGLQKFLYSDAFSYLLESEKKEEANILLRTFKFQTGMLDMAALKAGGVSMDQYLAMPPEDQAAFD